MAKVLDTWPGWAMIRRAKMICDGCGEIVYIDYTRRCDWCGQRLCQVCFDPEKKYCNVCTDDPEIIAVAITEGDHGSI
jgi:formylmethanofuran dehydrogenase subunit E